MLGSGLALLCIVVMIGIVAEDCEGLTMSTADHFPQRPPSTSISAIIHQRDVSVCNFSPQTS